MCKHVPMQPLFVLLFPFDDHTNRFQCNQNSCLPTLRARMKASLIRSHPIKIVDCTTHYRSGIRQCTQLTLLSKSMFLLHISILFVSLLRTIKSVCLCDLCIIFTIICDLLKMANLYRSMCRLLGLVFSVQCSRWVPNQFDWNVFSDGIYTVAESTNRPTNDSRVR